MSEAVAGWTLWAGIIAMLVVWGIVGILIILDEVEKRWR